MPNTPDDQAIAPFHLAIPVDDLEAADRFYAGVLGCDRGRTDPRWTDYNFFGHQLVTHLAPSEKPATNPVDGEDVPVRHFGLVLDGPTWEALASRIEAAEASFLIPPTLRHKGKVGEQRTFFILDPAGNALEFKTMARPDELFEA